MAEAEKGNKVKVHYTGKDEYDHTFDSSLERDPIELTLGEGQVIPGFEKALIGMKEKEKKTVTVPPEEGYGEYKSELLESLDRDKLPDDIEYKIGAIIELEVEQGKKVMATIADVTDKKVTVDTNHPYAGMSLTFELELVEIVK